MPDIDFDRQVFVTPAEEASRPAPRVAGFLILIVALGGIGFVGYKLFSSSALTEPSADSRNMEQVLQQLADMEKRIDQLEKRHKVATAQPAPVSSKVESVEPIVATRPARPSYKISAASTLKPQAVPAPAPVTQPAPAQQAATAFAENSTATNEAWQATTDRLADVVGVVGSQQGEILQTREQLNELLAQTQRTALSFELRRGGDPQPVGPVSLLLKVADSKNQRYSVCVYLQQKCIELKDRSVDEVVVFVLSRDTAPLELVATKINKGQIVGYLEVPR